MKRGGRYGKGNPVCWKERVCVWREKGRVMIARWGGGGGGGRLQWLSPGARAQPLHSRSRGCEVSLRLTRLPAPGGLRPSRVHGAVEPRKEQNKARENIRGVQFVPFLAVPARRGLSTVRVVCTLSFCGDAPPEYWLTVSCDRGVFAVQTGFYRLADVVVAYGTAVVVGGGVTCATAPSA